MLDVYLWPLYVCVHLHTKVAIIRETRAAELGGSCSQANRAGCDKERASGSTVPNAKFLAYWSTFSQMLKHGKQNYH